MKKPQNEVRAKLASAATWVAMAGMLLFLAAVCDLSKYENGAMYKAVLPLSSKGLVIMAIIGVAVVIAAGLIGWRSSK